MSKKVLIIGNFGHRTNQLDGQTVKTRNIYNMLKSRSAGVHYFDTQDLRFSKFSVFRLLHDILRMRVGIIIPASNMLKWIFPIVFIISKICRSKIIFIPVGGWLCWYLKDKRTLCRMISNVEVVMPQTMDDVNALKNQFKWDNVEYFPNFRITTNRNTDVRLNEHLRLVFFARINKKKGLDVVFYIADKLQKNLPNITIDFYGQINEADRGYFEKELAWHTNTEYKGFLQPEQIYDVLRQYDILLFPTRYINDEGFPGTILDGYMSGVPVIASNWCHSKEFVRDGYCGYICDINDIDSFYQKVAYLNENRDVLIQLKKNALRESEKYTDAAAFNIIKKYL